MSSLGLRELLDDNPRVGVRRTGRRRFWTTHELKVLRGTYPSGGPEACVSLLPGRSAHAIYQRAAAEGLVPPRSRGAVPRQRWFGSPQIDAVIKRVYQGTPKDRGEINALARSVGRPRWWVSKRATALGLKAPRFKELPWTEPELELIVANAHKDPETISRILRRQGFTRTPTAIVLKINRTGHARGRNADPDHYSANALAKLFGVDIHTITAWIKKGWLRARRRGTERTAQQGGDEWQVHWRDVRAFVLDNVAAIDIRKVDKFWFVDLLANRLGD
jgi:hypothetical protein